MKHVVGKGDPKAPILILDIGNSSISIGTWHDDEVKGALSVPRDDIEAFDTAVDAHTDALPNRQPAAIAISSVVPETLEKLRDRLGEQFDRDPLVVGERIALPISVGVDEPASIGTDRVCSAAAAYETLQTGCTVIDFGSAVTVDLVDNSGVLLGGSILPGLNMQLRALGDYSAVLPKVEPGFPELPYGKSTSEAIQNGVCRGIVGAVRGLVEGYATSLNRWPQVVATGGDLPQIGPHCDFLDTMVSNLVLRGVGVAYSKHISQIKV